MPAVIFVAFQIEMICFEAIHSV